eukprot:953988-Rhodomonas_salina.2
MESNLPPLGGGGPPPSQVLVLPDPSLRTVLLLSWYCSTFVLVLFYPCPGTVRLPSPYRSWYCSALCTTLW